jgi:hypothetical protein
LAEAAWYTENERAKLAPELFRLLRSDLKMLERIISEGVFDAKDQSAEA